MNRLSLWYILYTLCQHVFVFDILELCYAFPATRFRFVFSGCLSQQGSARNSADLQCYWADPARRIGWVEADEWPFASCSLKIVSHWPSFGLENMALYVPGTPHNHSTILIITTLNEDLHTGLIYKHTKEMGCSSPSQYEVWYWFAGDEAHRWCFIISRKEFLRAVPVSSQWWRDVRTKTQSLSLVVNSVWCACPGI